MPLHLLICNRLNQGLAIKVLVFMLQNLQIFLKVLLHLLEKRQLSWKISHLILSFQMILQKRCVLVIFQCNWMANCFKMHMMMSGILYMSIKNIIKIDCFGNVKRIWSFKLLQSAILSLKCKVLNPGFIQSLNLPFTTWPKATWGGFFTS